MKLYKIIAALLVAAACFAPASAQVDLVTAKECMARSKGNPDIIFIDASKPKNYAVNHIKGAININHLDLYKEGDIEGLLKSPEELAAFFGAKGISENSEIVVYDEGSQKYSTRIYWILKYIGAQNVRILHKDMEQCRDARIMLTADVPNLPAVTFTPKVDPAMMALLDDVKAAKDNPNVVLVDCRNAEEFAGVKDSKGHIPGAINISHEMFLTETGAFKSAEEIKALAEKNGITPDKEVILYCKTGVRASVAFVALKNVLGYTKVKLYDGAYAEWDALSNPIVQ